MVRVGPTQKQPTHAFSLSDGVNEVGFITCDRQGRRSVVDGWSQSPMPRTAIKMSQGGESYEDFELPFTSIIQEDFSGGMNARDFEDDRSKYRDGRHCDTSRGEIICGPKESRTILESPEIGSLGYTDQYSTVDGVMSEYIGDNNIAVYAITVPIPETINSQTEIQVNIYSDSSGPDAIVAYGQKTVHVGGPHRIELVSPYTLAASTIYWININYIGIDGYKKAVYRSEVGEVIIKKDEISFTLTTEDAADLTTEDGYVLAVEAYGAVAAWKKIYDTELAHTILYGLQPIRAKFFTYKRAVYVVESYTNGQQVLRTNGYRGAGKSNSANKSLLNTDQNLSVDPDGNALDLAGCIAMIISGPGSEEDQPWRTILSNTTTGTNDVITVDKPWITTQTTATCFVILGSDDWWVIESHGLTKNITDVAVTDDYVVFAQGGEAAIRFMREFNNSGAWTRLFAIHASNNGPATNEAIYADFLQVGQLATGETVLWRARAATCLVDYSFVGDWDATSSPLTGTMLFFDINYQLREDLKLQRDRLYVDLYESVINSQNDNYLRLKRLVKDLKTDVKRIIGDAGTIANPDDTYTEGGRTWTSELEEAEDRYDLADTTIANLKRGFDDLVVEHNRLLTDWAAATDDDTKISIIRKDHNNYIERHRMVGSSGTYDYDEVTPFEGSITTPTDMTYAGGIAHNAMLGTSTPQTGSDLAVAIIAYGLAKQEIRSLADRAYEIIGDGTIAAPGNILTGDGAETVESELKRAETDMATDLANITRAASDRNAIKRMINDLNYQITSTATESEDNSTSALSDPTLAAHTDTTVDVSHKFLKYYVTCGSLTSRITGMILYGEPPIPYILKEDSFGSINNNIYGEIPVGEMKALRSELNGTSSMVYGVYLYFNLDKRIERFYESRLDDVGPDGGEGLQDNRQGTVKKLMAYPGRYYALLNSVDGVPCIVCHTGMGWMEVWRPTGVTSKGSGATGQEEKFDYYVTNNASGTSNDMIIQVVPGNNFDRLWFNHAGAICSLPIAVNPKNEVYEYRDLSQLETAWVYGSLKDVKKYWHSIKIHSEDLSGADTTDQLVQVEYKVDNSEEWIVAGIADTSPVTELFLSDEYDVEGYRIKFRLTLHTSDDEVTPRIMALVVKGIIRVEVKKGWNVFVLSENETDLLGNVDYTGNLTSYMDEWANSETLATPLRLRHNIEYYDNKRVFIDPASISFQQVELQPDQHTANRRYKELMNFTIYEV